MADKDEGSTLKKSSANNQKTNRNYAGKAEPKDIKERDVQWTNLVYLLNACPQSPQKSLDDWKHVLKELKADTRKKAREIYVERNATGGGPPGKSLTDMEERLMGLLYKVSIEGATIPEAGLESDVPVTQELNLEAEGFNIQNDLLLLPIDTDAIQSNVEILVTNVENMTNISGSNAELNARNIPKKGKRIPPRFKSKSASTDDSPNTRNLLEKQISETHNLAVSIEKLSESILALSTAIEKLAHR